MRSMQLIWDLLWHCTHEGWIASLTDGVMLDETTQRFAFFYQDLPVLFTAAAQSDKSLRVSLVDLPDRLVMT